MTRRIATTNSSSYGVCATKPDPSLLRATLAEFDTVLLAGTASSGAPT